MSITEYGYYRDKEQLPQLNLSMYYGETSRIPLHYAIYPVSLVDKTYLPFMMAVTESMEMKHIRFVMDQGFMTKDNLMLMVDKGFTVLSLLPKNFVLYKETLNQVIA
ncbi:hypothetical protein [Fundicoccus culcitae]|uniref:Transposase IS4-like domain-containing protein n=1 Tax=Fundicoccus culcitae TaxID=2969821 RepID=A0ABY5P9L6_9LACT|nr:hypothetical protein [Fundicoccus culcitae]UUX35219.1 hypothetical protein NRE15_06135 [Fundicoccus culcitae]